MEYLIVKFSLAAEKLFNVDWGFLYRPVILS